MGTGPGTIPTGASRVSEGGYYLKNFIDSG